MIRLGITGGIGSGKSYIAHLLSDELGIPVYDCDSQAKRLTGEDPAVRQSLIRLVGPQVYEGDCLVKGVLADYLFQSEEHARQVNAIIHPAVQRDFLRWQSRQPAPLVALESAILFESGFHRFVDKVLFVDAPEPLRIRRAMLRDGTPREQILQRIRRQHAQDYIAQADYVLQNENSSRSELLLRLEQIVRELDETCKTEHENPNNIIR